MAIEVVKDKSSIAKERSEDDVLWAIKVALDITSSLNNEQSAGSDESEALGMEHSLRIASMLLEQYKENNS